MRSKTRNLAILTLALLILPFLQTPSQAQDSTTTQTVTIGTTAPDFTLPNVNGENRTLSELLKTGPVILSFYRGGWCPYCNEQLYAYQQSLPEYEALGAQLIAISPEKPESANDTVIKNELSFEVLNDTGNKVARQYDLIWSVPEESRAGYDEWMKKTTGKTLAEFNGINTYELPIPATFVIGQDRKIAYMFKDKDYKKRADKADILTALKNLKKEK